MKVCPYCKESIKDDALKCRYCQSVLVAPPAAGGPEQAATGQVTYVLDQDLVRFAKFAGAVLSVMVVVGVVLFGVDLKNMQERMSKAQEGMLADKREIGKSLDEAKALGLAPALRVRGQPSFETDAAGINECGELGCKGH